MIKVPFIDLKREAQYFEQDLLNKTEETLKSGIYIGGGNVSKFENSIADYCCTKHAISVGNGSDALVISMRVLGIKENDEVICPANSFIASAWAIAAAAAR